MESQSPSRVATGPHMKAVVKIGPPLTASVPGMALPKTTKPLSQGGWASQSGIEGYILATNSDISGDTQNRSDWRKLFSVHQRVPSASIIQDWAPLMGRRPSMA